MSNSILFLHKGHRTKIDLVKKGIKSSDSVPFKKIFKIKNNSMAAMTEDKKIEFFFYLLNDNLN